MKSSEIKFIVLASFLVIGFIASSISVFANIIEGAGGGCTSNSDCPYCGTFGNGCFGNTECIGGTCSSRCDTVNQACSYSTSCTYSSTCSNTGSYTTYSGYCTYSGSCSASPSSTTECTRNTNGIGCTTSSGQSGTCQSGTCVPTCTPTTCTALGYTCGSWSNGCGGTLNCGTCSSGYTCSSGSCVQNQICTPGSTKQVSCGSGACAGSAVETCNSAGTGWGSPGACDTSGNSCGTTTYGTCSAYSSGTCTGTQSTTSYACNGAGSCSSSAGSQSCTLLDGASCVTSSGGSGTCSSGSCIAPTTTQISGLQVGTYWNSASGVTTVTLSGRLQTTSGTGINGKTINVAVATTWNGAPGTSVSCSPACSTTTSTSSSVCTTIGLSGSGCFEEQWYVFNGGCSSASASFGGDTTYLASSASVNCPAQGYAVTFVESGLPSGTPWSASITNTNLGSTYSGSATAPSNIVISIASLQNTYTFSIPSVTYNGITYNPSPSSGQFASGGEVTENIKFSTPSVTCTASPTTVLANGASTSTITASISPIASGTPVSFSLSGTATMSASSCLTNSNGYCTVTTWSSTPNLVTYTASSSGQSGTCTVNFVQCLSDSDCSGGYVCNTNTNTCDTGVCSSNYGVAGCKVGYCCGSTTANGPGGSLNGQCVSSGTISGSYLCDPLGWNSSNLNYCAK